MANGWELPKYIEEKMQIWTNDRGIKSTIPCKNHEKKLQIRKFAVEKYRQFKKMMAEKNANFGKQ